MGMPQCFALTFTFKRRELPFPYWPRTPPFAVVLDRRHVANEKEQRRLLPLLYVISEVTYVCEFHYTLWRRDRFNFTTIYFGPITYNSRSHLVLYDGTRKIQTVCRWHAWHFSQCLYICFHTWFSFPHGKQKINIVFVVNTALENFCLLTP